MNLIGAPDEWIDLIDPLVPDILDLVISTWKAMPSPASDAFEDPITLDLCRRLRMNRSACELPFQIHIQMVELDQAAGDDQGRMDIAFLPLVPREDIYFCLECKRLNVVNNGKVRPYTSEYITHGMLRFINGQYAARVRHGGMLGYVLDGNVAQAITNVSGLIKKRFQELKMESPGNMLQSSIYPGVSNLKETHHSRQYMPGKFQIHHIFAAGSSNI
ncbi:MAG: hypothetical protein IID18_03045 [Nitrospinae bacterium]|nr:hypothetical protein [Nitrospinota bacterium]